MKWRVHLNQPQVCKVGGEPKTHSLRTSPNSKLKSKRKNRKSLKKMMEKTSQHLAVQHQCNLKNRKNSSNKDLKQLLLLNRQIQNKSLFSLKTINLKHINRLKTQNQVQLQIKEVRKTKSRRISSLSLKVDFTDINTL